MNEKWQPGDTFIYYHELHERKTLIIKYTVVSHDGPWLICREPSGFLEDMYLPDEAGDIYKLCKSRGGDGDARV